MYIIWFQVFVFNNNNDLFTKLYGFKHSYLIIKICLDNYIFNNLFAQLYDFKICWLVVCTAY